MANDSGGDLAARDGEGVRAIREDLTHGASYLARQASRCLADALSHDGATGADVTADDIRRARALARELALVRPSMAAIGVTVARVWWAAVEAGGAAHPREAAQALRAAAGEVEAAWESAAAVITGWLRPLLTGAVATLSRSSSVEALLISMARERVAGQPLRVVAQESRPGAEGVALARALAAAGANVTLVADTAFATVVDRIDAVVVGADSVRADGSLVNKVGTHALALIARDAGKPFYVACERLKVTPASYPLALEEMDSRDLLPEPVDGVDVHNPYFDVTPSALITTIVTEGGPLSPEGLAELASAAEREYTALMDL